MISTQNYYSGYADHMWRFYIRHRDGILTEMDPPSRANWTSCHHVWLRITGEWRDILTAYYAVSPDSTVRAVDAYCSAHRTISPATVWSIVNSCRNMAAEERGLIGEYAVRKNTNTAAKAEKPTTRKPMRYHSEE